MRQTDKIKIKGHPSWNKGLTKETDIRIKNVADMKKGVKHFGWKGDSVGYSGLHSWMLRNIKKRLNCDNCGKKAKLDHANISGNYKRDLSDWEQLCRSCHIRKDGNAKKAGEANKGQRYFIKSVNQYTKDMKFIKHYEAIRDAMKITGISETSIANVLSGRSRTAGGYIWSR